MPVAEVSRRMGVSEQRFDTWMKVCGGLGVGELQRRRKNKRLKVRFCLKLSFAAVVGNGS
jgi:hypothetical protein